MLLLSFFLFFSLKSLSRYTTSKNTVTWPYDRALQVHLSQVSLQKSRLTWGLNWVLGLENSQQAGLGQKQEMSFSEDWLHTALMFSTCPENDLQFVQIRPMVQEAVDQADLVPESYLKKVCDEYYYENNVRASSCLFIKSQKIILVMSWGLSHLELGDTFLMESLRYSFGKV